MTSFKTKEEKERNFELRFVTSVEQITPFLENLTTSNTDNENSDNECEQFDKDDFEVQQIAKLNQTNEKDLNCKIPIIVLPSAITGLATAAAVILPSIYDEYVNFIDLSVLNPIVSANDCQNDQLIESEISEQLFFLNILFECVDFCFLSIC